MNIGIIRETKTPADSRVPFTPKQCGLLQKEFPELKIFVQPSSIRCFTNEEYIHEHITVTDDLSHCNVLMGIKEVSPEQLIPQKTYFFFSHTIKKQSHNKKLLKTVLEKEIKLVDYELLIDSRGMRMIGFGRWAGLIGTYNAFRAWCLKYGIPGLPPPQKCNSLEELRKYAASVKIPPVRIAVTGDGRVAGGAEEMLDIFGITKINTETYVELTTTDKPVYTQLDPSKYNRHSDGMPFDLQHFFSFPQQFQSEFPRYCKNTDMLIMAAYWDPRAPVLFMPDHMKADDFNIRVIGDITCDLNGSVPSTIRTSTFNDPYYDFNPFTGKEEAAFSNPRNITVMAIDNLPCGLPREASEDFGHTLTNQVMGCIMKEDGDNVISRAVIADQGQLMPRFGYLHEWVNSTI
jgi:saccharopine dehydrogenase (NAD+, L-lysine forming)